MKWEEEKWTLKLKNSFERICMALFLFAPKASKAVTVLKQSSSGAQQQLRFYPPAWWPFNWLFNWTALHNVRHTER